MAHKQSLGLPLAVLLLASLGAVEAQTSLSRLAGDWRSTAPVTIPESRPPISQGETDLGSASPGAHLQRILLLLSSSTAQQEALADELGNLQNPASPAYHDWLTPESYADTYSNSASDVAAVQAWLESQGFLIAPLPAGRGWIEFSGTVAQVEQAFQTSIHSVATAGGNRLVLMRDISVPEALAPLINGLVSLDGGLSAPALSTPLTVSAPVSELAAKTSLTNVEALTPQLVAQLIHLDTLHAARTDGAGESIAIAARSNVNSSDVAAFRQSFALPTSPLQVVLNGADPGLTADQAEATLSASWAGAAAPGAKILLVPAATTSATDGIDLSLAAIVDQALAHTVAVGFSACEAALSPAHQAWYSALFRQAAAEGIAVIAAAGDSGPAACHLAGSNAPVTSGYGVNALASTPWDTAVGVAAFGSAGPANGNSALAAWSPVNPSDPAFAGGGGTSILYATPAWQPVPADLPGSIGEKQIDKRLLPDLVLPTAIDSAVNPGLAFCLTSSTALAGAPSGCTVVRSGGSSAAVSLFAGIAALLAQKYGAQGNLAPGLYSLSETGGVFNDVQQGSARLRCTAGSPGCGATEQFGFTAAKGYDLASGLGSADAQALVSSWHGAQANGSGAVSVTLAISPIEQNNTYNPSANVTLTATVLSEAGGPAATGSVVFYDTTTSLNLTQPLTIGGNGNVSTTVEGVFAIGGNEMIAKYLGDTNYAPTNSTPPVNVNTQASTTSLVVTPSNTSAAPGQSISVTVTLTVGSPAAGTVNPSGVVTLNVDGGQQAYTASLTTSGGVTTANFPFVLIPANSPLLTHTLQAIYPTNTDYSGSTSPQISVTVTKTTPKVTLTPATSTPFAGSSLLLTATIAPTVAESAQPSGTVTITLDGAIVGAGAVTPGAPSTAVVTIPLVNAGAHILQATYSGDTDYTGSTSATVSIVASKGATVTTLTATPPALAGGVNETLTAAIAPTNSVTGTVYTITGTVTFFDGSATLLGQVAVANNVATLTGVPLKDNVSHTITAVYSGDVNWLGSVSAVLPLAASTLPDFVVLTSNVSTVQPGGALVLTATVTPNAPPAATGEQNPTGMVIFYDGTTQIGAAALTPSTVLLSDASTATLTTETLPGGEDAISAFYVGDDFYNAATSNILTLDVLGFTITPAPTNPLTNLNIVQGAAGSASFVVTALGGFSGEVQLVCAVPSQDDMSCIVSPQQVVPTGTVKFLVQTYISGGPSSSTTLSRRGQPMGPRVAGATALALLLGFFVLPFGRRARIFTRLSTRHLVMLFLLLVGLGGAGIGCTSSANMITSHGTPLGVSTLKITGSAYSDNTVVSQSVYLTVNVTAPGTN